jgi:two-component system cell cycle response regulator
MMPDLTGIELCQRIRDESRNNYTYVIILTALREKHEVIKGLTAGADDFLTKPFDSEELLARIGVGRRVVDLYKQIEVNNRLLEELAHTDSLTGLPNRRAIEVWATRELASAARHNFSFWVVLGDLDNFKSLNDTYGHEAGDTVLRRFAEILQAATRSADICGRIGGEEFLIVLTHSNQEGAKLAIDRIRESLAAEKFKFGQHEVAVTASFGMASYSPHQSQTFNRLTAQADVALYSSKSLGRNRVEIANTELSELNAVVNQPRVWQ